jgi:PAS domain-containing protein
VVELIAGTTRDISARKAAEDSLREAIRRSDAALLAGEVGTYYWDIINDRLSGDRNFHQMFGVLRDESASAPVSSFIGVIHPDNRNRVSDQIQLRTGAR